MYIICAEGRRGKYYFVATDKRKRGFMWVPGAEGLQAAQRFGTQEEAGEVTLKHREHEQALARIVPDPLSPPRSSRTHGGFIIKTEGGRQTFYLILKDGVYRWSSDKRSQPEAFRFSTQEAARKVVAGGYGGAGGGSASIVPAE
ncbi:MAG TPA: hypothetical protein VLG36_04445 [Candidatus Chromulinivoraceae bacterium]|nr:hypothetical protein [Candidatus Chromulinivoraceae bacterium]